MSMKKVMFVGLMLSLASYALWSFGWLGTIGDSDIEAKLYSIRTQEAMMMVLLSYIAWRVTPEAKQS